MAKKLNPYLARVRARNTAKDKDFVNKNLSLMDESGKITLNPEWKSGRMSTAQRLGEMVKDATGRSLRLIELAKIANKRKRM